MEEKHILVYGELSPHQKAQVTELFIDGFGHLMTFEKSRDKLRLLLQDAFSPSCMYAYVKDDAVLGIIGLADQTQRPVHVPEQACLSLYGKGKGGLIYKQMYSVFQSSIVKQEKELYIDVLATDASARRQGIGSALLQFAFSLPNYLLYSIEVFSKNTNARSLYQKMGFVEKKKKVLSPFIFLRYGYPIFMIKEPVTLA